MFSLCTVLTGLLASHLAVAHTVQVQQEPSFSWQAANSALISDYDPEKWNLNHVPNPNATDHLVFDTVHSVLQHWPSVRVTHGHNIIPATVPIGTLLYHVRGNREVPVVPDWVAMDPEHAYWFCGWDEKPSCWQLTLVTTRPLKVVYFDGLSAAKTPFGHLDTQDLLAWGEFDPKKMMDERLRIDTLCEWGKNRDVDGFVRTEMAFEIMLCNFTSVTSFVSSMSMIGQPHGTPTIREERATFEVWHAGSWHDHFPGETRIQPDLPGLVSFYDTQLVPSLVAVRAGQQRQDHRVRHVSKDDLSAVVSRLEAALARPSGMSSGIDWRTLLQVIVDRYAGRLEVARRLLSTAVTSPDEMLDLANKTQMQLRIMLTPYLPPSVAPTDVLDRTALDWAVPVYAHCAMTHTSWVESEVDTITESEKLLLQAVRGTTREICRVVTKMWVAGVYAGIDSSVNTMPSLVAANVIRVWNGWGEDLDGLMAWLDWSVWTRCEPGCSPEEICALFPWHESGQYPLPTAPRLSAEQASNTHRLTREALRPKCISVVDLEAKEHM